MGEETLSLVPKQNLKGRGVSRDLPNRFRQEWWEPEPGELPDNRTELIEDHSASILSKNSSPDVPFRLGINPYRGCEHGCVYCYARPSHEYLGYSPGLDFERKIVFKPRAAALLKQALAKRSYQPEVIALSGNTDCYQPVERRLKLTRGCLEVLAEARNPTALITKSALVARDIDLLADLASHEAACVTLSLTTLDPELTGILEPRASRPARRLQAIRALSQAGVPTGVLIAPVIPGLNDHEIPAILAAAAEAGATRAGWILLRLPGAVEPLFEEWLATHLPTQRAKILARLRAVRGGKLHESRFGERMRGQGPYAKQLEQLFELGRRRAGIPSEGEVRPLSSAAFRKPTPDGTRQLPLFGECT